MPDIDITRLAQLERLAFQLAARVRSCNPEDNKRWLLEQLPDPTDWFRLTFLLAAAVPDDKSWSDLTRWAEQTEAERDRAQPLALVVDSNTGRVVKACGTPAAARRHAERGEPLDQACLDARRAENRIKKRRYRARDAAA